MRDLWVADARARAETLAAAAGVGIIGGATISEGGTAPPIQSYPVMRAVAMSTGKSTPVEQGMSEISISVAVTFTIH